MKSKYEFLIGGILLIPLIIYGFLLPDPVYNLSPGNYTCIGDCGEPRDNTIIMVMVFVLPILVLIAIILMFFNKKDEV